MVYQTGPSIFTKRALLSKFISVTFLLPSTALRLTEPDSRLEGIVRNLTWLDDHPFISLFGFSVNIRGGRSTRTSWFDQLGLNQETWLMLRMLRKARWLQKTATCGASRKPFAPTLGRWFSLVRMLRGCTAWQSWLPSRTDRKSCILSWSFITSQQAWRWVGLRAGYQHLPSGFWSILPWQSWHVCIQTLDRISRHYGRRIFVAQNLQSRRQP